MISRIQILSGLSRDGIFLVFGHAINRIPGNRSDIKIDFAY